MKPLVEMWLRTEKLSKSELRNRGTWQIKTITSSCSSRGQYLHSAGQRSRRSASKSSTEERRPT
jgi:hypothetical protein